MAAIRDLRRLLAELRPVRQPGRYVFTTATGPMPAGLRPVMTFTEDEGLTLILAQDAADASGLPYDLVTAWITLTVSSALDAVGLTAAVAGALADAGLSCNVIAATHHDHLFVPETAAAATLAVLQDLAARAADPAPSS
jgi:hypothetical protein